MNLFVINFFEEYLESPLSPQIKDFALPCLIANLPLNLQSSSILKALVTHDGKNRYRPPRSVWYFYYISKFLSPRIQDFTLQEKLSYLSLLRSFTACLPERPQKSKKSYEDDEEMDMDIIEDDNIITTVLNEALERINDPVHVQCLLSLVEEDENKSEDLEALVQISYLSHAILDCHHFAVHHYRLKLILFHIEILFLI